jgi:hypothetical protein
MAIHTIESTRRQANVGSECQLLGQLFVGLDALLLQKI